MRERPYPQQALLRVTTGRFKGWRGVRWECERTSQGRFYSLHARYYPSRTGRINAGVVGLGVIINVPEEHLAVVDWRREQATAKRQFERGKTR